jgi:hypothetical protein
MHMQFQEVAHKTSAISSENKVEVMKALQKRPVCINSCDVCLDSQPVLPPELCLQVSITDCDM